MNFIAVIFDAFFNAVKSTLFWCVIWLVFFFVSAGVMETLDPNSKPLLMSALSITTAVFAGHATKLLSYFFGCDTEFQNLFDKNNPNKKNSFGRFGRFMLSLLALIVAIYFLFSSLGSAGENVAVISSDFGSYSIQFWPVITALVCAQLVFSWPNSVQVDINGST